MLLLRVRMCKTLKVLDEACLERSRKARNERVGWSRYLRQANRQLRLFYRI